MSEQIETSTMKSSQAKVGTIIQYDNREFTVIVLDENGVTIKNGSTEIVTRLGLDPSYQGIVKL